MYIQDDIQKTSTSPLFIAKIFAMEKKFDSFYVYIFLSLKKEKQGRLHDI